MARSLPLGSEVSQRLAHEHLQLLPVIERFLARGQQGFERIQIASSAFRRRGSPARRPGENAGRPFGRRLAKLGLGVRTPLAHFVQLDLQRQRMIGQVPLDLPVRGAQGRLRLLLASLGGLALALVLMPQRQRQAQSHAHDALFIVGRISAA